MNARSLLPQAVILSTAAWYWSSSNNAIATQILFRHFQGIFGRQNTVEDLELSAVAPLAQLLTTCQLLLGGVVGSLPFLLLRYSDATCFRTAEITTSWKQPLETHEIVVGVIHYIGSLCTNLGFGFGSASLVQCIKLLEPIETLVLMVIVIAIRNHCVGKGQNQTNAPTTKQEIQKILTPRKVISTITVISGTFLLLAQKSIITNPTSIMFALCSGFCMSLRNVLKKHGRPGASRDASATSEQLPVTSIVHLFLTGIHHFARITGVAAVPSVLVTIFLTLTTNKLPIREIIYFVCDQNESSNSVDDGGAGGAMSSFTKATLYHCFYNIFSITVLSMTCASVHSLLNVGKRIANVIIAAIVFRVPLSISGKMGIVLACIGACFYNDNFEIALKQSGVTNRKYRYIRRGATFALSCMAFGWSEFFNNIGDPVSSGGRGVGRQPKVMSISHLFDSSSKFVVWMYPFSPPSYQTERGAVSPSDSSMVFSVHSDEILICPYATACKGQGVSINLAELTERTFYHNYVLDHLYWKTLHFRDFAHHIQAIAMISILERKKKGICVRVLGGSAKYCDAKPYQSYNPYANHNNAVEFDLESTRFPFEFLQMNNKRAASSLQKTTKIGVNATGAHNYPSLPLAPDMNTENFATYGAFQFPDPLKYPKGYYNSGEDIQSLAGAGWFPFLSSINDKYDPLKNNYTGYYMNNCLNVGDGGIFQHINDTFDRLKMMEKVELLSIFAPKQYVTANYAHLKEYTTNVYGFGCRSTLTYEWMQQQKIKTYFSACLTLTSMYEGALLSENGTNPSHNAMTIVNPSRNLSVAEALKPHQKELILIVDLVDKSAVPESVKKRARFLSADIPKAYPKDPLPHAERMRYCYRLISQYKNYAKVIITSRIHVGLPASAMGVPVIFVSKNGWLPGGHERTGRVAGLLEVFHRVDKSREGMEWTFGDLEGHMPPNPGNHYADRFRASFWNRLRRNQYYADAARLFGRIPMKRLGAEMDMGGIQNMFHFIMNEDDLNVWHTKRAVENVLYFHPNAKVYVHVDGVSYNHLDVGNFDTFAETGYNVTVLKLNIQNVAKRAKKLLGEYFSSTNLTLSVQAAVLLHEYGGVFVSKNTYVTKELPSDLGLGFTERPDGNLVMMVSKKGSIDVLKAASIASHDNSYRLSKSSTVAWDVNVLSKSQSTSCLEVVWWEMPDDDDIVAFSVLPSAFVEHVFWHGTRCFDMLEKHCIYCDETEHWSYPPGDLSAI